MQIEIQSQHCDVHPRWQGIIQHRAAKLTDFSDRIIRLHVTLVHSTHHLRGNEEVRLLAAIRNDTLRVRKSRPDMGDAIHAAFVALERELHTVTERRRRSERRSALATVRARAPHRVA